ncbi:hypothetical protein NEOLEDRAFT_1150508 [Neolentinus lepideus HHB14362 ss-1]|uniref:Protein-S-isoprenylcysteine O-methyltransferase n=1 Tax=Neolentinus lepideus HHB14362 ss-1 TaxID=1314782 RepID=A0A165Q1S1_9AGAM|nr:hypothetical protein NEOLEDRAFT_1150508 [Neolentinus lepideus HHB14362 ss-1]
MSLLRAPLTLLATYGMGYALTQPNPPISNEERAAYRSPEVKLGRLFLLWPMSMKVINWANGLCEVGAIVAHNFPRPPLTDRILSMLIGPGHSAASLQVNRSLLFATFLTTVGSYIRHQCYRTLGRFFTYELSIRKKHQLVTAGPYSVVRHPAYTGSILSLAGIHVCIFGPGSLLRASGVLDTEIGKVIIGAAALHGVVMGYFFISRTIEEDKVLKNQFGEQWDRWAQNVPYRLIPYVF